MPTSMAEQPPLPQLQQPDLAAGDKQGLIDRGITADTRREVILATSSGSPRRVKQQVAVKKRQPNRRVPQKQMAAATFLRQRAAADDAKACFRAAQGLRISGEHKEAIESRPTPDAQHLRLAAELCCSASEPLPSRQQKQQQQQQQGCVLAPSHPLRTTRAGISYWMTCVTPARELQRRDDRRLPFRRKSAPMASGAKAVRPSKLSLLALCSC